MTVTRVDFLTAAQLAAQRTGADSGLDPDRLLCYVEMSGTFHGDPPPSVNAQGTPVFHVSTYHTAFVVFDAHSGNLLIEGAST